MTFKTHYATREQWLEAMYLNRLRPHFGSVGHPITATSIRFSCGFPKGGRGKLVGQCWSKLLSKDGTHEIFISPVLDNGSEVTATLAHELVHVAVGLQAGHGPSFRKVATAIGLTGPMMATTAGDHLTTLIAHWCTITGEYPHAELQDLTTKKQTTRMIKCTCPVCGYIARVARKWIDVDGPPICPSDQEHMGAQGY